MNNLPVTSTLVIFGGVGIALWLSQFAWAHSIIV